MTSQLDAQLAEAAGLANESAGDEPVRTPQAQKTEPTPPQQATPSRARHPRRQLGLLIGLLVIVAATVGVVLFGFSAGSVYAMPVDQLLGRKGELVGRRVRVDGELVPGSLVKRDDPCEYLFLIRSNGQQIEVSFPQCVVPASFRDRPEGGVMVTAEGALKEDGRFVAASILAKCSSRYDPKTREMKTDG
jgi:cytochrome c-type biogenesis protein CcmE